MVGQTIVGFKRGCDVADGAQGMFRFPVATSPFPCIRPRACNKPASNPIKHLSLPLKKRIEHADYQDTQIAKEPLPYRRLDKSNPLTFLVTPAPNANSEDQPTENGNSRVNHVPRIPSYAEIPAAHEEERPIVALLPRHPLVQDDFKLIVQSAE